MLELSVYYAASGRKRQVNGRAPQHASASTTIRQPSNGRMKARIETRSYFDYSLYYSNVSDTRPNSEINCVTTFHDYMRVHSNCVFFKNTVGSSVCSTHAANPSIANRP